MSVVAERERDGGRRAHYDLLDLHKPATSTDMKGERAQSELLTGNRPARSKEAPLETWTQTKRIGYTS